MINDVATSGEFCMMLIFLGTCLMALFAVTDESKVPLWSFWFFLSVIITVGALAGMTIELITPGETVFENPQVNSVLNIFWLFTAFLWVFTIAFWLVRPQHANAHSSK